MDNCNCHGLCYQFPSSSLFIHCTYATLRCTINSAVSLCCNVLRSIKWTLSLLEGVYVTYLKTFLCKFFIEKNVWHRFKAVCLKTVTFSTLSHQFLVFYTSSSRFVDLVCDEMNAEHKITVKVVIQYRGNEKLQLRVFRLRSSFQNRIRDSVSAVTNYENCISMIFIVGLSKNVWRNTWEG